MTAHAEPVLTLVTRFAAERGVVISDDASLPEVWARFADAGYSTPGLSFAAWLSASAVAGVLLPAMANSPNLDGALARFARYHPLFGAEVFHYNGDGLLRLLGADEAPAHRDTVDACFAMVCRLSAQLAGARCTVRLRRDRPAAIEPYLAAMASVAFGCPNDEVSVDQRLLSEALPHADDAVLALIDAHAERQVAMRAKPWRARVALFAERLAPPPLIEVARELLVSTRTLQLLLHGEGTTYSQLIDDHRRERTLALLKNSDRTLSAIGSQVGFASAAALTRAVRRWTGMPPRAYREANQVTTPGPFASLNDTADVGGSRS